MVVVVDVADADVDVVDVDVDVAGEFYMKCTRVIPST